MTLRCHSCGNEDTGKIVVATSPVGMHKIGEKDEREFKPWGWRCTVCHYQWSSYVAPEASSG